MPGVLRASLRSCGTAVFYNGHTNKGKKAPVFGSQGSLVFDPTSPKTQVTDRQISTQVGDDWGILGVVCFCVFAGYALHIGSLIEGGIHLMIPECPASPC